MFITLKYHGMNIIVEILLLIAPIRKLLIDNDLSGSTEIFFLNDKILWLILRLKLFKDIFSKKIVIQNIVLLPLWILTTL